MRWRNPLRARRDAGAPAGWATPAPPSGDSDIDTVSGAAPEPTITVFSTSWCGYCSRLKAQLTRSGVTYVEVDIERDPAAARFVERANRGNRTVPTVLLPDGTTLTNPPIAMVLKRLTS